MTVILNWHYRGDKLIRNFSQTMEFQDWTRFRRWADKHDTGDTFELTQTAVYGGETYYYFRFNTGESECLGVAK